MSHPLQIGRKYPAHGVKIDSNQPTIIFLTVCASRPASWLAAPEAHSSLLEIWRAADTSLVGDYLLMPDHLHLFCAPRDLAFTLEKWVTYWKRQFSRKHLAEDQWQWQRSYFDYRLRSLDDYREKLEYVRENPVANPSLPPPTSGPTAAPSTTCSGIQPREGHVPPCPLTNLTRRDQPV